MHHAKAADQEIAARRTADPLLRPFTLKSLHLRNRIVSTSHASMLDDGGLPLERYVRYHEEKARGGLAMTMIGGSAMTSPDSSWGGGQLDLSSDRIVPHLRTLSDRIHAQGAAVMSQVSHLGRRATSHAVNWLPILAPSRIREARNRGFPREMDAHEIDRVVRDYADAAKRCADGGLDGVETVTGGHLIGQFLSPRTNRRTDGFGGSVANRARFGLMVHEAIRKAVGDAFVVGIRFVVDEGGEDGSDFDDCLELARLFEGSGLIDYFNCIYGRMDSDLALTETNMPGLFQKSAPYLAHVVRFRRESRLPLIHAGGIRDVATARHTIAEGVVDLVGMTRAHIADPHLVRKIAEGQEERIRPCVGASYCLYKKVNCVHNAASGRETKLSHTIRPARARKRMIVVGGGPAGLEAARVCAERGHAVILFEAGPMLGGQLLVATKATHRGDLIGIVDWRDAELRRLGVDVRLNAFVDAADVMAERPDVVIVATGGIPDVDWFNGAELCTNVWDVLGGSATPQGETLLYDGTGRQAALSCAIQLAGKGQSVRFVTPDDAIGVEMPYSDRTGFRKRVAELNIPVSVDLRLVGVDTRGNRLVSRFSNEYSGATVEIESNAVIVEHGTLPMNEIYLELKDRSSNLGIADIALLVQDNSDGTAEFSSSDGLQIYQIGDSISSRDIYSSIHDAYRLCSRL